MDFLAAACTIAEVAGIRGVWPWQGLKLGDLLDAILYSYEILTDVSYSDPFEVTYTVAAPAGTEYLRLTYVPTSVTLDGATRPN